MTVIKNKDELVARAKWHAKNDHITQGTYGSGTANGETEFAGCAIGCMATPHGAVRLRDWILDKMGAGRYGYEFRDNEYDMIERLEEQFGICPELARLAESVFESLPWHGAAINFVPRFCEALPEGADITPDVVAAIWHDVFPSGDVDEDAAVIHEDGLYRNDESTRRGELILDALRSLPVAA